MCNVADNSKAWTEKHRQDLPEKLTTEADGCPFHSSLTRDGSSKTVLGQCWHSPQRPSYPFRGVMGFEPRTSHLVANGLSTTR
ncbi:hypothetical protein PoB_007423800 [Plakobranchus ocellatus]|uniref:Uncharacterized protein n=1 Tax=Plakobranchus ocellatus TaxID=259542 RepID=A0AAV4DTW7_9GAST|nr:hypothetical protein PoB_007423800 [Plakobranchus ocellatus]